MQVLAFRGGGSSASCTLRKFSPGAVRRTRVFLEQGDFGGGQEGAVRGVHRQPFQAVSQILYFHFSLAVGFFFN